MMSPQTLREDMNATIRENGDSNATIREGQSSVGTGAVGVGAPFRGYRVVRQLPSTSTEADIFVVERENVEYILKLYRYGIEPKNDILQSIKALSEAHPQDFIRVYEADFDKGSNRWFEIQEYAMAGTLQAVLDDRSKLTAAQQSMLFNDVAREIGESLNLLHQNNLLHLDIKPSNILLRSMNPLDMVLIDFGIATSLASDMSKKFTQTRGTPMYQSPESYTGGMGRASDWWGLGMILLEIAAVAHPFKGLSANVIAYSIATEPVNIPENLDEGQKELFHGLLTRNPEKRWNWEQVSRWLKGERGIPQYFEETAADEVSTKTPFVFMGQKYQSLAEIAAAFAKDVESWNKGKEFLMRGYVRQWLEGNQEFDATLELDNILGSIQDSDEKMFRFIQKYGQNIPFIFCGKAITLQNLLLFSGKSAKREVLTPEESKIVNMIENGNLLACLRSCQMSGKDSNVLRMALEVLKGKSVSDAASFLNFYMNPKNYYCPFVKDDSSPEKVISASIGLKQPPRPITDWKKLNGKYILPKDRVDSLSDVNSYHATFSQLEAMAANGLQLIPCESSTNAEKREKEALASASQREYTACVYKWVLGYDDASLKSLESSLSKFRGQAAYASGFEKAQLDLWLAYLDFLAKRTMPLTDEDKKLLRNVRLKDSDAVCGRLQSIVNIASTSSNHENVVTPVSKTKKIEPAKKQKSQPAQASKNSSKEQNKNNQVTTTTIDELLKNPAKYNSKAIQISGIVNTTFPGNLLMSIRSKNNSENILGCIFSSNYKEEEIKRLREGQEITVSGIWDSSCLRDCTVMGNGVIELSKGQEKKAKEDNKSVCKNGTFFELWGTYDANPIMGKSKYKKYKSKTFIISGTINSILEMSKKSVIVIVTIGGKKQTGDVYCEFPPSEKGQIMKLRKGQSITVTGKLPELFNMGSSLLHTLKDCKLFKG